MKLRLSLLFGLLICSVFLSINGACFASEYRNTDNVQSNIRDAIVKIYTVFSDPDYFSPWKMEDPGNITASGCIIDGHKILTNAHVVANHRFIQVRKNGNPKKYIGQVLAVSHEADLALLTVSDKEFFSDTPKLDFGPLPQIKQDVLVYGFPDGGDSLSITKGVLSRIENQVYSHSSHIFLSGQVDAAINPGNSGGPVVVDTKIVGVVMQTGAILENIKYMVPNPVIKHFLSDIKDGKYDGFPDCGLVCQN